MILKQQFGVYFGYFPPVLSVFKSFNCIYHYHLNRCLNACTYCKTKHSRGNLASYPIDELVDRAKQSFQGKSF